MPKKVLHIFALTCTDQLKEIILNLYSLMVQSYEYQGPATADAMTTEVYVSNQLMCCLELTKLIHPK